MSAPIAIVTVTPGSVLRSALPAASVALDGTGSTPGSGASSITGYAWHKIDYAVGSTTAISNPAIGTPTLGPIDAYGNSLVFLVVTDNLGGVSETDWRKAPNSAFGLVRVPDDVYGTGLELLAAGQRDWYGQGRAVVVNVETLTNRLDTLVCQNLTDVGPTVIGANLDHLTNGDFATDTGLAGGVALHQHEGLTVATATTSALGVVKLAESPIDPANPKAVTQDRMPFVAYVDHSDQGGSTAFGRIGDLTTSALPAAVSLCAWQIATGDTYKVNGWTVNLADAGVSGGGGGYTIDLVAILTAKWLANDFTGRILLDSAVIAAPAISHEPMHYAHTFADVQLDSRYVLAVYCQAAPAVVADQGGRMSVTVDARITY